MLCDMGVVMWWSISTCVLPVASNGMVAMESSQTLARAEHDVVDCMLL
jgi:hypothetical protein